jgi:hypothetical protein
VYVPSVRAADSVGQCLNFCDELAELQRRLFRFRTFSQVPYTCNDGAGTVPVVNNVRQRSKDLVAKRGGSDHGPGGPLDNFACRSSTISSPARTPRFRSTKVRRSPPTFSVISFAVPRTPSIRFGRGVVRDRAVRNSPVSLFGESPTIHLEKEVIHPVRFASAKRRLNEAADDMPDFRPALACPLTHRAWMLRT